MSATEAAFLAAVRHNPVVVDVLTRAEALALPGWYLTAGCLFQTVWNVLDGHDPGRGIRDYDLLYFDGGDLSWAAEDAVVLAPRHVYEAKAARWRALWPRLTVLPWPGAGAGPSPGPDAAGGHGREIRAPRRSPAT